MVFIIKYLNCVRQRVIRVFYMFSYNFIYSYKCNITAFEYNNFRRKKPRSRRYEAIIAARRPPLHKGRYPGLEKESDFLRERRSRARRVLIVTRSYPQNRSNDITENLSLSPLHGRRTRAWWKGCNGTHNQENCGIDSVGIAE